ncbi:flagellar hook-basal body complex protein FliE [Candidatus Kuenenia stuttgartiensis]|jgi:flagellar hook-basal body complex protein FliE|nr:MULTISPECIES: flagellar hook-basal body complex protein FliE [Kuenenia]MBE7548921.1 flagellar hook-basal body complex protein FliE [Planctomycetia bacterium]MBZ0192433.1 flagellar hook-basal body complex protein FliE [Candidatus Kuenenia stuttgartiensis]MCF6153018.1 flagellar hook-basal body complex protein FliE [Candidatus Kuenenia stuttgartiensis]MCL4727956.1 flagellar hook-basal body complex protein FliE [Candidatus Kuenenia stuttgartiensis]MCZ7622438.1 flagellar hook-basal body complex 
MAISPLGKDQIIQNHKNDFDSKKQTDKGTSFQDAFGSFFNEINELQTKTNDSIEHLSSGKVENIHEVMVAMSKAEVSFKYMMEARNKLVKTYTEVMKEQK